jgi:uncharacterized protein with GYD domain
MRGLDSFRFLAQGKYLLVALAPGGGGMPKFLIAASYTAEGLEGLRKDTASGRKAAVAEALESVGGRLDAMYYALGDHDAVLIADLPNRVSVAGFALIVSAAGLARTNTMALFTVEEIDQALKMKAQYRPPGAAPVAMLQF